MVRRILIPISQITHLELYQFKIYLIYKNHCCQLHSYTRYKDHFSFTNKESYSSIFKVIFDLNYYFSVITLFITSVNYNSSLKYYFKYFLIISTKLSFWDQDWYFIAISIFPLLSFFIGQLSTEKSDIMYINYWFIGILANFIGYIPCTIPIECTKCIYIPMFLYFSISFYHFSAFKLTSF